MLFFFFQAEDGIRDADVTGVQTCALPILPPSVSETSKFVGTETVISSVKLNPSTKKESAAEGVPTKCEKPVMVVSETITDGVSGRISPSKATTTSVAPAEVIVNSPFDGLATAPPFKRM